MLGNKSAYLNGMRPKEEIGSTPGKRILQRPNSNTIAWPTWGTSNIQQGAKGKYKQTARRRATKSESPEGYKYMNLVPGGET